MTRFGFAALALLLATAAPAYAEVSTNAITANAITANALTNNAITPSLRAGAGSVLDVVAVELPSGPASAK